MFATLSRVQSDRGIFFWGGGLHYLKDGEIWLALVCGMAVGTNSN